MNCTAGPGAQVPKLESAVQIRVGTRPAPDRGHADYRPDSHIGLTAEGAGGAEPAEHRGFL